MKKTDKRTVKIILINPLINNNKYIDIYPNKITFFPKAYSTDNNNKYIM